jgi:hypothetical protein
MIEVDISEAFGEIGLAFIRINAVHCLAFNKMNLRESRGLREFWTIDFYPQDLPARCRQAKFGSANRC